MTKILSDVSISVNLCLQWTPFVVCAGFPCGFLPNVARVVIAKVGSRLYTTVMKNFSMPLLRCLVRIDSGYSLLLGLHVTIAIYLLV
jgi:hypothetical protein